MFWPTSILSYGFFGLLQHSQLATKLQAHQANYILYYDFYSNINPEQWKKDLSTCGLLWCRLCIYLIFPFMLFCLFVLLVFVFLLNILHFISFMLWNLQCILGFFCLETKMQFSNKVTSYIHALCSILTKYWYKTYC